MTDTGIQPRHTRIETSLGELTVVAENDYLTGIYFPGHSHLPEESTFGVYMNSVTDQLFTRTAIELADYLAGTRHTFSVPTHAQGDDFSTRVWKMLAEIPYGHTTTYGALAKRLGNPHLAQRVGQVVGRNPISIIIPCHRVIGANGSLTGYAGGLDRKRFLLELEEPTELAETRLF